MFVAAIVLWFILTASMGKDRAKSLMGKIIGGYFAIAALLGLFAFEPTAALLIAGIVGFLVYKANQNKEAKSRQQEYGWTKDSHAGTQYHETASNRKASSRDQRAYKVVSTILPNNVKKREKLVTEFSNEYKLFLTEEQVKRIVNATYMSEIWKREVEAMSVKYDIPDLWYSGPTRWLRAYLYAFTVQDVTSDFAQQERIASTAFEEVLNYSDSLGAISLDERIQRINDRFMTQFDDVTFMIAYNFMQDKGAQHQLESARPGAVNSTVDELEKKYAEV